MTVDWVLKNVCLVVVLFSSRSNPRQGKLTECSKLTCFAKRLLNRVPGAVVSKINDRSRLLPDSICILVRSKASWGGGGGG